jgi:serine phosphatase RsbU (regulator of sigma subunit)
VIESFEPEGKPGRNILSRLDLIRLLVETFCAVNYQLIFKPMRISLPAVFLKPKLRKPQFMPRATVDLVDNERVVQRYRLIMVLIGIFYPLWRYYAYFITPTDFESYEQRGLIGVLFLTAALLTYIHPFFKRNIGRIFNGVAFIWVTQVFVLIWASDVSPDYLLMGLITIFCIGGSFLNQKGLLWFYLLCVALTGVTVIVSPHPETITFFFGVVLVLSISYACFLTLVTLFKDLNESKEALALRTREFEELSAAVQTMFLPNETWVKDLGFEIAGYYRPAEKCGGDWWSFFVKREETLLVFVGDITGHGPGSAMMTASVASYLKALRNSHVDKSASELLKELNLYLLDLQRNLATNSRYLMTMAAVELDLRTKTLHLWSAGAPFPFLMNETGEITLLGGLGNPLGLSPELSLHYETIEMNPKDRLFIYTDGIIEMSIGEERQLGERRLKKMFSATRAQKPADVVRTLETELDGLKFSAKQEDDFTFVILDVS